MWSKILKYMFRKFRIKQVGDKYILQKRDWELFYTVWVGIDKDGGTWNTERYQLEHAHNSLEEARESYKKYCIEKYHKI